MTAFSLDKLNTPEAVFISDISERDIHRVADENLLAERTTADKGRRFDLFDLILLNFYFHTASVLSKAARMAVIDILIRRYERKAHLALTKGADWTVALDATGDIKVDLSTRIAAVNGRYDAVQKVNALVSTDLEFDGEAVFQGTRVPVRTVDALLKKGMAAKEILSHFPTLTEEMISAASLWVRLHPVKGRPKTYGKLNRGWELKSITPLDLPPP